MDIRITPVRQHLADNRVEDIADEVRRGLRTLPLSEQIEPGWRIAVAVGSRGISCLKTVVHAVLKEIKQAGGEPFLVPAMGSHGGGTAEMQRKIIEEADLLPDFME